MSVESLRNSGPVLLGAIVRQIDRRLSTGGDPSDAQAHDVAGPSGNHALGRLKRGFDLGQVISEYRALRMSVLRLWAERQDVVDADGVRVFNETIDEALAEAAERYTGRIHEVKDQFVGVLGHDLGNPLSAIIMAGRSLMAKSSLDEKERRRLARIVTSADRMHRMIRDVLDLTRQRFHRPMPLNSQPTDLGAICRDIVAEVREAHPERTIRVDERGDLRGQWDSDRMAEVVSNLVSNAIAHGAAGSPVDILVTGDDQEIVLAVKNQGEPDPERGHCLVVRTLPERLCRARRGRTSRARALHHARDRRCPRRPHRRHLVARRGNDVHRSPSSARDYSVRRIFETS